MEAARWFISGPQRQEANRQLKQDCEAFGVMTRKPVTDKTVFDVDVDNQEVWELFLGLSGDWRIGPSGAMGIGKVAIKSLFQLKGIRKRRWPELTDLLQAMEMAALDEIRQQREQTAKRRT